MGLPDCRAYEMVSPLDKQAHDAETVTKYGIMVGPDGTAAGFGSEGNFANPQNEVVELKPDNSYLSLRGGSGWSTAQAFAPANLVNNPFKNGLASDLQPSVSANQPFKQVSCGVAESTRGEPAEQASNFACAVGKWIEGPDGQLGAEWPKEAPIYPAAENIHGVSQVFESYLGASSDLSHVFFQPLYPVASSRFVSPPFDKLAKEPGAIYEIAGAGTANPVLRIVNVANNGTEMGEATGFGSSEPSGPLLGDSREPSEPAGVVGTAYHAISESGGTVFFTATPTPTQRPVGELSEVQTIYARTRCTPSGANTATCHEYGNGEFFETVAVSNPSPSECDELCMHPEVKQGATFEGASADGSKVFFTTTQELLQSDTDETTDLYEYDLKAPAGHHLTEISAGETTASHTAGTAAEVEGVVRNSRDGSHIYFLAKGVLTEEANGNGEKAMSGATALYGYDANSNPDIKFVARMSEDSGASASGQSVDGERLAQTTPDGNYLVFSTEAKLEKTGDTNTKCSSTCPQAVYRYDFETGALTWVSKAGPGFTPTNEGLGAYVSPQQGTRAGAEADFEDWNRAISGESEGEAPGKDAQERHDGETIIFATEEQLQAADENKHADVYEWHCASPCANPATEGTVSLISDGYDPRGVITGAGEVRQLGPSKTTTSNPVYNVSAMSASGSDIFFFSHTPLVGQDSGVLEDLYDARVNGGFPKPPQPPSCSGEGCQQAPTARGTPEQATSSGFTAGGNLNPAVAGVLAIQTSKPKPLTQKQKLAKALKTCKRKPKKKRASCESQARKKYGAKAKAKRKAKKSARRAK